jgi:AGCS family alanine or glycine:cation symporter
MPGNLTEFLEKGVNAVWGTPLVILLTAAGLVFTLRTMGIQWRILTHGLAVIRGKYDNPDDPGNLSHFQALCAALSATIGLGNISGVAVAVSAGGPGAVFWMWVVGFLGMATKFTTCSLAVMYRTMDRTGTERGGPMWYIEKGLGRNWKPVAMLFALLGAVGSFGGGNMFQANQVANILEKHFDFDPLMTSITLALLTAAVIIGGIRRIGRVAASLVPTMCVIYFVGAAIIIVYNIGEVPALFAEIFRGAFGGTAMKGAFAGIVIKEVIQQGAKRACFSNEAGLGSAPMAHATAKTNEPIREGVVAGIGPFIDTIVICTMTALVILITGSLFRQPIGEVTDILEPQVVTAEEDKKQYQVSFAITLAEGDQPYISGRQKGGETLFIRGIDKSGGPVDLDVESDRIEVGGPRIITAVYRTDDTQEARSRLLESFGVAMKKGNLVYLQRSGVTLTAYAFDQGIPLFGTYFVPLAVFLFALSTMISWSFYGETCTEYLLGESAVLPFKLVYVAAIVAGGAWKLGPIIDFSDIMFGLMVVPNLLASILLSGKVASLTKDYFRRLASGAFDVSKK